MINNSNKKTIFNRTDRLPQPAAPIASNNLFQTIQSKNPLLTQSQSQSDDEKDGNLQHFMNRRTTASNALTRHRPNQTIDQIQKWKQIVDRREGNAKNGGYHNQEKIHSQKIFDKYE